MELEINFNEIKKYKDGTYEIVDIRAPSSFEFGHIEGAINIPANKLDAKNLKDKTYFLCCRTGKLSLMVCEKLKKEGANVFSIGGGYMLWLKENVDDNKNVTTDMQIALKAEESIRKKFHRELQICFYARFINWFSQPKLLSEVFG